MKFLVLSVIIFGVMQGCWSLPPTNNITRYKVDFSLPASQRWTELARTYKNEIRHVRDSLFTYIPENFKTAIIAIADFIDYYLTKEYADELKSVSDGCGISVGELLTLNLAYEISDFCTSIITSDENGLVTHGRNQDFDLSLRNNTVEIVGVDKQGNELFTATTFVGFLGIPTGMVKNKFSISINARDTGGNIWDNLYEGLMDGGISPSYLTRKILEKRLDFDEAVKTLATTHIIAPIYYIIAGCKNNEGVVLTQNRRRNDDAWYLSIPERWYLVQTNYDHWEPVPIDDNKRRATAMSVLDKLGRKGINADGINLALTTPPVLNNYTLYSSLISARNGFYVSYKRNYSP